MATVKVEKAGAGKAASTECDPWVGTGAWLAEQLRACRAGVRGEYRTRRGSWEPLVDPAGVARVLTALLAEVREDRELAGRLAAFVAELYAAGWLTGENDGEVRAALGDLAPPRP
ncbi:hypothetical protein ACFQ9X_57210 [Catenulispora yoronensis]